MKILVTGGAGYIGSHLVPFLLGQGHSVTVVDSFAYGQSSLLSEVINRRLELIKCDVRDFKKWATPLGAADVVIPLAAIVGAPACQQRPAEAASINLTATLELFQRVSSGQLIIMPTTNSAYGSGRDGEVFTEQSRLRPISQYAREKVEVEENLMQRDLSVSLRLATVFGMSQRMRTDLLVNNFVLRALTDKVLPIFEGHFVRNYIHVRDVVNAIDLAIQSPSDFAGGVFNVGLSQANVTKLALARMVADRVGGVSVVEIDNQKDGDQRNYIVSNEKIEAMGFKAEISLEDGIDELARGLPLLASPPHVNLR